MILIANDRTFENTKNQNTPSKTLVLVGSISNAAHIGRINMEVKQWI